MQNWNPWQIPAGPVAAPMPQPPMGYPAPGADPMATMQSYMQYFNQPAPTGYTAEQWAAAQQQNWAQWQTWQQQYQQWQAQYGEKYEQTMKQMSSQSVPSVTPMGSSIVPPPPLPKEDSSAKPPLPPDSSNAFTFSGIPPPHQNNLPLFPSRGNANPPLPPGQPPLPPDNSRNANIDNNPSGKRVASSNVESISAKKLKIEDEELTEAEKKFDAQFKEWEEQFNKWKQQNANHPDKTQYKQYESEWTSWREKLIERREQMRRKREQQKRAAAKAEVEKEKSVVGDEKILNILSSTENQGLINNLLGIGKTLGLTGKNDVPATPQAPPVQMMPAPNPVPAAAMGAPTMTPNMNQAAWAAQQWAAQYNAGVSMTNYAPNYQQTPPITQAPTNVQPTPMQMPNFNQPPGNFNQPPPNMLGTGTNFSNAPPNMRNSVAPTSGPNFSQPPPGFDPLNVRQQPPQQQNSDQGQRLRDQGSSQDVNARSFRSDGDQRQAPLAGRDSMGSGNDRFSFDSNRFSGPPPNDLGGMNRGGQFGPNDSFGRDGPNSDFSSGKQFGSLNDNNRRDDTGRDFGSSGHTGNDFRSGDRFGIDNDRFGLGSDRDQGGNRFGRDSDKQEGPLGSGNFNTERFGSTNDRFGSNNDRFTSSNDRFGPNNDRFNTSNDRSGSNNDLFGSGGNRLGSGNDLSKFDADRIGSSNDRYRSDNDQFGLSNNRFGPPSLGLPNDKFTRPPPDRDSGNSNSRGFGKSGNPCDPPADIPPELQKLMEKRKAAMDVFKPSTFGSFLGLSTASSSGPSLSESFRKLTGDSPFLSRTSSDFNKNKDISSGDFNKNSDSRSSSLGLTGPSGSKNFDSLRDSRPGDGPNFPYRPLGDTRQQGPSDFSPRGAGDFTSRGKDFGPLASRTSGGPGDFGARGNEFAPRDPNEISPRGKEVGSGDSGNFGSRGNEFTPRDTGEFTSRSKEFGPDSSGNFSSRGNEFSSRDSGEFASRGKEFNPVDSGNFGPRGNEFGPRDSSEFGPRGKEFNSADSGNFGPRGNTFVPRDSGEFGSRGKEFGSGDSGNFDSRGNTLGPRDSGEFGPRGKEFGSVDSGNFAPRGNEFGPRDLGEFGPRGKEFGSVDSGNFAPRGNEFGPRDSENFESPRNEFTPRGPEKSGTDSRRLDDFRPRIDNEFAPRSSNEFDAPPKNDQKEQCENTETPDKVPSQLDDSDELPRPIREGPPMRPIDERKDPEENLKDSLLGTQKPSNDETQNKIPPLEKPPWMSSNFADDDIVEVPVESPTKKVNAELADSSKNKMETSINADPARNDSDESKGSTKDTEKKSNDLPFMGENDPKPEDLNMEPPPVLPNLGPIIKDSEPFPEPRESNTSGSFGKSSNDIERSANANLPFGPPNIQTPFKPKDSAGPPSDNVKPTGSFGSQSSKNVSPFDSRGPLDNPFKPQGPLTGAFGGRGPTGFGQRGPGDFGPRGPGDFGPRGPGNFGPRGPGDFGPRGPGDFGPQGPGNFGPRGPGDFGPQGPGHFGPRGPGDFGPRGPGDFGPRGPCDFGPRGPGDFGPRGPGDFGPRGPSDFGPRGPGDFGPRGPGDFGPQGPGNFGPRGPGDFGPRGPGDFGPRGPADFGPRGPGNFGPRGPGDFGPPGPGDFGPRGPGDFGPQGPGNFGPQRPSVFGPQDSSPGFGPQGPGNFGPREDGPPLHGPQQDFDSRGPPDFLRDSNDRPFGPRDSNSFSSRGSLDKSFIGPGGPPNDPPFATKSSPFSSNTFAPRSNPDNSSGPGIPSLMSFKFDRPFDPVGDKPAQNKDESVGDRCDDLPPAFRAGDQDQRPFTFNESHENRDIDQGSGSNTQASRGAEDTDWRQPFNRNKFGDLDQRPGNFTDGPPVDDRMSMDRDRSAGPSSLADRDAPSNVDERMSGGVEQNVKFRSNIPDPCIDEVNPSGSNENDRIGGSNFISRRTDDRKSNDGPKEFCVEKQFNYNHGGGARSDMSSEHSPANVIDYGHQPRVIVHDYVTPVHCYEYGHGTLRPTVADHEIYPRKDFKNWVESEQNLRDYDDRMRTYESDMRALKRNFNDQRKNEHSHQLRERNRIQDDKRSYDRDRRVSSYRSERARRDADDHREREKRRESRERGRIERDREWERSSNKHREDRSQHRRSRSKDRTRERPEKIRKEANKENKKDEERSKGSVSGQESSAKKPTESATPENSGKQESKDEEPKESSPEIIEIPTTTEPPKIVEPPPTPVEVTKTPNFTMVDDLLCEPGRQNRPPKIAVILRGPPGSGKSFVAKLIKDKEVEQGGSAPRILSLDDYFLTEKEIETEDDNGKKITTKEMVYEYEEAMEPSYITSLNKAFKKNITDGFFNFIILDAINEKISDYEELWSFAKSKRFRVYVCEMEMDVQVCMKRNIHNRTEDEINRIVDYFEPTPSYHQKLDVTSMLQEESIEEVQMEDTQEVQEESAPANDDSQDSQEDPKDSAGVSKWERMEAEDKLDRLDGLAKRKHEGKPQTMEDFLQVPDYYNMEDTSGKRRVRWADLEERKEQEKMRAVGFVVGQTNWDRMMDPTKGGSALTRTKYI